MLIVFNFTRCHQRRYVDVLVIHVVVHVVVVVVVVVHVADVSDVGSVVMVVVVASFLEVIARLELANGICMMFDMMIYRLQRRNVRVSKGHKA